MALGLVATISALVLSLLLSTAKAAYDARANELIELSADILLLDRVLAYYGPEAGDARLQLRAAVREAIERFWPGDDATVTGFQRGRVAARRTPRPDKPIATRHRDAPGAARSGIAVDDRDQSLPFSARLARKPFNPYAVPDRADHVADRDFHRSRPVRAGQPDRDHYFPGLRIVGRRGDIPDTRTRRSPGRHHQAFGHSRCSSSLPASADKTLPRRR